MSSFGLSMMSLGISAGQGLRDIKEGAKRQREVEKAIENFTPQELTNAYEGMSVPTVGMRLQSEQAQRSGAAMTTQAAKAGSRGMGASMDIANFMQQTSANIGAQFEAAQFNLEQMKASDQSRMRDIQERRDIMEQQGMQSELAAARAQRRAGATTLADTAASGAEYMQQQENKAFDMVTGSGGMDSLRGGGQSGSNTQMLGSTIANPSTQAVGGTAIGGTGR